MDYFKSFGINIGEGKHHEESIYGVALLYNLLHTQIGEYLSPYKLTIGKLNVLVTIRHRGGDQGISQVDISKHLIVTPANMTRLLDKLEKEGHVQRSAQPGDRRVNLIRTTEQADKLLDDLWPGYIQLLEKLTIGVPKENQKSLSGMLMDWIGELTKG